MPTNKRLLDVLEKDVGPLTFGKFLRAARDVMNVSQAEMARKIGVARGTLCDIEKGRQLVSPTLAVKIAKTAGLSEAIAVKACLQDQLKKAQIKMKVAIGE
jgi:DNA-binding XRE family transcriptional regulator